MTNKNIRFKIRKNINKIESYLISGLAIKVIKFNVNRLKRENLQLKSKLVLFRLTH